MLETKHHFNETNPILMLCHSTIYLCPIFSIEKYDICVDEFN